MASNMRIDTIQHLEFHNTISNGQSCYLASKQNHKAMTKIFDPLLHIVLDLLIYIDDILIFSPNEEEHAHSLYQFNEIIKKYGIMFSEKYMIMLSNKQMHFFQTGIDYLGMHIRKRQYIAQSYIAE